MAKDIHVFKIKKINKGELFFVCQFTNQSDRKVVSLLEGGKYGRVTEEPLKDKIDFLKHERFEPSQKEFAERTIEVDLLNQADPGLLAIKKFWAKFPKVKLVNCQAIAPDPTKPDINPNLAGEPELILEDMTETKDVAVNNIDQKAKAVYKYASMSDESKVNCAYYFGVANAGAVGLPDLKITMIDFAGGILMQGKNLEKFIGNPVTGQEEYSDGNFAVQVKINTVKAIEMGIIEKNGETFYVNKMPIGTTNEEVVQYMNLNQDLYFQYIVEKLGTSALIDKAEKKKMIASTIETVDLSGLRAQAQDRYEQLRALGVRGMKVGRYAAIENVDSLKKAIEEADAELARRKGANISVPA